MADVAIQKSTREGFGLVVSETLWKGTAMVAGHAGGIPQQLHDGVDGYLADSTEQFASRISELLENPLAAERMGAAGVERVRETVSPAPVAARPSRRAAGSDRMTGETTYDLATVPG